MIEKYVVGISQDGITMIHRSDVDSSFISRKCEIRDHSLFIYT